MRKKYITILLSTALAASIISGCGNSAADTSENATTNAESSDDSTVSDSTEEADSSDNSDSASTENSEPETTETAQTTETEQTTAPASYDALIESLHAGQSYAYVPICEGDNALLVTSYTFDDLEGHEATYEATIYAEKSGSVQKITTIQSGGTAYPLSVTAENSLIFLTHNNAEEAYVDKNGEFVVTAQAAIKYAEADTESYHNYKKDSDEVPTDSSVFDEISEKYGNSEVISFEDAGISSDGTPKLAGGVYAAYIGDDLYNVNSYIVFEDETTGHTQTPDGVSGVPFTYEQNATDITFHFGSADDTTEAKFDNAVASFPTLTFSGDNAFGADTISISCIGNADAKTFDVAKYYDNDNNLYMKVKSFDEKSLTGDLLREERIKKDLVDDANEGDSFYSINGTQFTAISFEDVNKELAYDTDDAFKKDVVGTTRFDKFLVKCSDDNMYYALEKQDYEEEYNVVSMMTEEKLRKLVEENVTFKIKEDSEIILLKVVENGDSTDIENEYIIGREFLGDNYPGWSEDVTEYFITSDMLVAVSTVDGELYNFVQIYVP